MERAFDTITTGPTGEWADGCGKEKTLDELPKHRGNQINRH